MRHLTFEPYIPLSLWLTLAVAAVVLLAWYGWSSRRRLPRRRWAGVVALMALAIAVPLAILVNPTWVERMPPPAGKPLLTVLVDRSASMATQDAGGTSRYEAACRLTDQVARRLENRYEVRVRAFSEASAVTTPEELRRQQPDGSATDLAAGIEAALDENRPQGQAMLLLSDGIDNTGGGARRIRDSVLKAKAMAAPILIKTLGGQAGVNDVEVELSLPEELAFVGQKITAVVDLRQRGSLGRRTALSLKRDGEVLERRQVELFPDGLTEETFDVTQKTPGLYRYEIEADPLPGEVTAVNNGATLLLRVIDKPVRVLLLEGKPYWDTKFLVRTLAADDLIDLTSVVRLAEGRFLERHIARVPAGESQPASSNRESPPVAAGGSDPKTVRKDTWNIRKDARVLSARADLDPYQILVLGRDAEFFLTDESLQLVEKWLNESSGSLVCFRGPPASQINQRLGRLMPVRWTPGRESRFRVQWTEAGKALRWLPRAGEEETVLPGLPSLAAAGRPEASQVLSVVLATNVAERGTDQTPVLSYQRVGSGRVVVVEGAGMWRWAFLPPQHQDHADLYGTLWRSLVRWLVANVGLLPRDRMALQMDKVTFSTSESVTAELLIRKDESGKETPRVELTGDALEQPRQIAPVPSGSFPGQFRVAFGRLPEGRYWAKVIGAEEDEVSAQTAFDVRGNLKERLEVQARPDMMQLIADQSGGAVLDEVDPGLVMQNFERHLTESRPERIKRTTAWDRWWVLVGALGIWGFAWGLRRWSGLV